jgi:signal transduction histidine kinase
VQLMIDRMRETCETLMELSGETGELELLRHEGVDDVLRGVLVAVAPEVEEADVTLIGGFSCASSPPLDGPRLARAFEQVILNALEASTRGGRVWVDSHCARGETIVRVTDEGTGWPDPIRDQVFDPFVSYAKPGHCGVGLTAAKKIIEAHGGEIEALDADGTGAVVQIRIPIP